MKQGPEKLKNPSEIQFIHETISPTLSKPKPGESICPSLDSLTKDIKNGRQSMLDFPPIEIFSIRDPETNDKTYYSLNNRKLYIAKKSNSLHIRTQQATFAQILDSEWKMTSTSDGIRYPKPTNYGNKECMPTGLLLQFRMFLADMRTTNVPKALALDLAKEQFQLKCRF